MSAVALITGGQQGIGLGIARKLKEAGFKLALASEQPPDAPAVTAALEELGGCARYFQHDLAQIHAVPALLDAVDAELGCVTCLVSNAGVGAPERGDLLDLPPENWDFVQDINLKGSFFLAQAVAQRMLSARSEATGATIPVDGGLSIARR